MSDLPAGTIRSVTVVVCDDISAGSIQLASVSTIGMPFFSTTAYLKTTSARYYLGPGTATADGVNVINAFDGGNQWFLLINVATSPQSQEDQGWP